MKLFEDSGIITRHAFGDGRARYETIPEAHHDHLIDLRTGRSSSSSRRRSSACRPRSPASSATASSINRLELYCVPLDEES